MHQNLAFSCRFFVLDPGRTLNTLSISNQLPCRRSTAEGTPAQERLKGRRRNDHRPFSRKILLAIGARRLWTLSLSLSRSLRSLRCAHVIRSARSVRSFAPLAPFAAFASFAPACSVKAPFARSLVRAFVPLRLQSPSSDCSLLNFRAKMPMIVASPASESCRFFVFGSKPYAQHPFDFESAPS